MRSLLLAAALTLVATSAQAQRAPEATAAETAFWEGRRLFDEGRFAEACERFEASHRLTPSVGVLFNMALCHEKIGEIALAHRHFVEAEVRLAADDPRRAIAAERALALKARLPQEPAAEPQQVEPTAVAIPPAAREAPVSAPRAADAASPDRASPPERGPHRAIGWTAIALGGASLALGAAAGAVAIDADATVREDCGPRFDACSREGFDAASRGETWAAASTVAFVIGAVGVAAGATVLVLEPSPQGAAGARLRWAGAF